MQYGEAPMILSLLIKKIRLVALLFVLALFVMVLGGCFSESRCYRYEADEVFRTYGALKTRTEVLRRLSLVGIESDTGTNPVEALVKDPNGCSLGSNGQTVVRFYFDKRKKLTKIQVFKNYIAEGYQMELIDEREY